MRLAATLLLCLLPIFIADGQTPRFDRFDIFNGLSQNNINALEIDDNGNIWVGTLDGLNRYNGYTFDIFKPFHDRAGHLTGNHILAMGKGLKGNMWVTTRSGGLNYYEAATNRFHLLSDTLFQKTGISPGHNLTQSDDSTLWFSHSSTVGVLNLNTEMCSSYQAPGDLRGIETHEGSALIYGSFGIISVSLVKGSSLPEIQTHSLTKEPCYQLQHERGKWYAVNTGGVTLLNKHFESEHVLLPLPHVGPPTLDPAHIDAFAVHNGTFWLGARNLLARSILRDSTYTLEHFKYDAQNPYSFKGYAVTHLKFDVLGNLWIGTEKNGVNHFNHQKNQFLLYNGDIQAINNPGFDPVRAICKTNSGDLWLGFDRQGVGVLPVNGRQRFYLNYLTKDNKLRVIHNVRTLFQDSEGTLWMGAANQLCLYNRQKDRFEAVNCRYDWNWPFSCYAIKELERGTLTLTASPNIGFVNLRDGQLNTLPQIKGKIGISGTIRDFTQDKYRNLWLAKDDNGIHKITYPGMDYEIINTQTHQLSDNKVYCLLASGDSLWIGTNAGLNLFSIRQQKIIRKFFETDGLCNNVIYSIDQDKFHNLWLSTNKGISHLEVATNQFTTYLPNDFFMDDAHFKDAEGNIYYGGYSGVVSFDPSRIRKRENRLKITLESFQLFNQTVYPADTLNGRILLTQALDETLQMKLSHRQNGFSIGFNAYPFDYPNTNVFRYRLKGLQDQWSFSDGTIRKATYTGVPPGDYIFQIEAAPYQQAFGHSRELHICIIPPFWQTTWFKVLSAIFILVLILAGYRIRLRQIRKQNLTLQSRVADQTAELRAQNKKIRHISEKLHEADQSKLRFFTNLSHEFRTPLTLILGHLENLNLDPHTGARVIRNNALRLLRLVNQLIDLRKLDQQQLQLSITEFDMVPFTSEIVDSFKVMAQQKNIQLRFQSQVEKLDVWLDQDLMEKILYNLIANALQYTPNHKSVEIMLHTSEKPSHFELTIRDEGIGLSLEEQKHIFERFYRSKKGQMQAEGHGIGLAIVKGLTDAQRGTIHIESEPGKGTSFELTFPIQNQDTPPTQPGPGKFHPDHWNVPEAAATKQNLFSKLGGKNILIVEDNQELTQFLMEQLQDSFTLKTAGNGKEALSIMQFFTPELIISDIMMPGMDGIEFCKTVKTNLETSHIPIILLTAKADQETRIEGFEMGIDDYIEKPFNTHLLLVRIKALLENRDLLKKRFEELAGHSLPSDGMNQTDQAFIDLVNQALDHHYSDPLFNIEKLSEQVYMSRSTFYRKFSGLTGMGPADYLRKIRLKKATVLLNQQTIPISQIAENIGFQSAAHFRKCFKEEFGVTPGGWRKRKSHPVSPPGHN